MRQHQGGCFSLATRSDQHWTARSGLRWIEPVAKIEIRCKWCGAVMMSGSG